MSVSPKEDSVLVINNSSSCVCRQSCRFDRDVRRFYSSYKGETFRILLGVSLGLTWFQDAAPTLILITKMRGLATIEKQAGSRAQRRGEGRVHPHVGADSKNYLAMSKQTAEVAFWHRNRPVGALGAACCWKVLSEWLVCLLINNR